MVERLLEGEVVGTGVRQRGEEHDAGIGGGNRKRRTGIANQDAVDKADAHSRAMRGQRDRESRRIGHRHDVIGERERTIGTGDVVRAPINGERRAHQRQRTVFGNIADCARANRRNIVAHHDRKRRRRGIAVRIDRIHAEAERQIVLAVVRMIDVIEQRERVAAGVQIGNRDVEDLAVRAEIRGAAVVVVGEAPDLVVGCAIDQNRRAIRGQRQLLIANHGDERIGG